MTTTDLVKEWLANEGYKSTIDEDGDIQFRYQGAWMYTALDKDDPLYLKIIMPQIYELQDDRIKVLETLNDLNARIKAMKGFIVENNVHLCIEMYIDSSPEIEDFFERCLDILVLSARIFHENLRGE